MGMIDAHRNALCQTLIAALWADGEVKTSELELLAQTFDRVGLSPEQKAEGLAMANKPLHLSGIPVEGLSLEQRRDVFRHAFVMVTVDRSGGPAEREFLRHLLQHLGIPLADGRRLMTDGARSVTAGRHARAAVEVERHR